MEYIADSLTEGKQISARIKRRGRTLDCALRLAEAGFRVFPLGAGATAPNPEWDWQHEATREPERIFQFWTDPVEEIERPFNIAIALDADTLVIEVRGKSGANELAELATRFDVLPGTYLVHAPDRAFHHYYRVNPSDGPFAAALSDHVALRTVGDFVVAEGSRIGIHRYNRTAGEPKALRDLPSVFLPGVRI